MTTRRLVHPTDVQPGDVLVVRNPRSCVGKLIRMGQALNDDVNAWNHVIIAVGSSLSAPDGHGVPAPGIFWGIEARAGGVGWVDVDKWVKDRWTISNSVQPKTDAGRALAVSAARALLGTPYDFAQVIKDALDDLRPMLRTRRAQGQFGALLATVPLYVVCSSLAAKVYDAAALARPHRTSARFAADDWQGIQPADWARFCLTEGWR
jgi:hypothetical protein